MQPYNSFYPTSYQNPYYQQQMQALQQQYQQLQQQYQQLQQQNGAYVTVQSEEEAREYRVPQGMSMTFFNETAPFCYKKTASASPLDAPIFEVYEIVKRDGTQTPETAQTVSSISDVKNALNDDVLREIDILKNDVSDLKIKYEKLIATEASDI